MGAKPKLVQSEVVFDEAEHTYRIGNKYLSGVTSLLHRVIFRDMYKGVSEKKLKEAAARGTMIHSMIEEYHTNGIDLGDTELAKYMEVVGDLTKDWLASEYLVSDNERYASKIDLVYYYNGSFILGDIKTVSKMDATYKDYCSWQLSVYAYMFEKQNPKRKVKSLMVIWIPQERYGQPEIIEIDRKPDKALEALFKADEANDVLSSEPSVVQMPVADDVAIRASELFYKMEIIKKQYEEMKSALLMVMQDNNIVEARLGDLVLTRTKPYVRESLDTEKIKRLEPKIAAKYTKYTNVSESLKIKYNK